MIHYVRIRSNFGSMYNPVPPPCHSVTKMSGIFSHLSYPVQAVEEEIDGTVIIRFTLMKSGEIDSIKVITPVHPLLDAEAIRLIRNMPKWKPVYWQGEPVALSYEVPVIFELLPPETGQDTLEWD